MKPTAFALATLSIIVTAGCSSTRITRSEVLEEVGPVDLTGKKVAAMVSAASKENGVMVEKALARQFTKNGIEGVAGHTIVPEGASDAATVQSLLADAGVEALVFVKLVGTEDTTSYVVDDYFAPNYGTMVSYYDSVWHQGSANITARTYTTYFVEVLCYRVSDGKLIWKGLSESFAPNSPEAWSKEITKAAGKVMRKQGLLATGKK